MRTLSRSGGLLACLGAIAASSIAAAAEPAAYPASRTPVVSSAALRAAEATPASSGATADLAQPTFLAPVATSPGGDSSVNVPGLSQPQFLITDHGTPETGNTASNSDWRTHKANPPQSNEAPADPPSAWSLLWRQAAGTNSNASNRYSANNAASQSRPAASARDAATAQNQLDTDSVWSEIKAVKPASSPQRQLSSSDQPGSFDSLVNQLGLSEQTSNSNADVPPTAVGGQNSERLSQTQ